MSAWSFFVMKVLPGLITFIVVSFGAPALGMPGYFMWLIGFNFFTCLILLTSFTTNGTKSTGMAYIGISLFIASIMSVMFIVLDAFFLQLPETYPLVAGSVNMGHASVYFVDFLFVLPPVLMIRKYGRGFFGKSERRGSRT